MVFYTNVLRWKDKSGKSPVDAVDDTPNASCLKFDILESEHGITPWEFLWFRQINSGPQNIEQFGGRVEFSCAVTKFGQTREKLHT